MSHHIQHARGGPAGADDRPTSEAVRVTALATGVVAALACLSLALFFLGLAPFGGLNDSANAVVGWLTLALAVLVRRTAPRSRAGEAGVAMAAVGALLMTWGSWLVLTDTTGYYLAGLVSTLGVGAIGAWLLLAHRAPDSTGLLERGPARLGRLAGAVMMVGILALPGALAGVDDLAAAPWHALTSGISWLGLYLLYPWWCTRVAGRSRPGRGAPRTP